jgi:hypothetical protein
MEGIVDRIEDGKIAVIDIKGGGRMLVPAGNMDIIIR